MSVETAHPLYVKNKPDWDKIDNVCDNQNVEQYLVTLNPEDKSEANKARNAAYRKRAVFYALSGETVAGFIGTIFDKEPTLELNDPKLDYIRENSDGAGQSIYQQSQEVAEQVIRKGRAGLYVSYPPVEGPTSKADEGKYFATIRHCTAQQVINWRTKNYGAKTVLSLVVIETEEEEPSATDPYTLEIVKEIRELILDQDYDEETGEKIGEPYYRERHWRETVCGADGKPLEYDPQTGLVQDDNAGWYLKADFIPTKANGSRFDVIPFTFVGSQNNLPDIDVPPMKGIVNLNIAHYRNSADHEDELFFCAQAQPYIDDTDVSQTQIDEMKKVGAYWGSRTVFPVKVGIAQVQPTTALSQAMKGKVDLMVGLGARMLQPGSAVKTATQSGGEQKVALSVLSLIASNISEAFNMCLGWVSEYMGASGEASFELNRDYAFVVQDSQELGLMMNGFDTGKVPVGDFVRYMQKKGLFLESKSAEEYAEEISSRVMIE